jgi:tetratricopeptide (TPR) repeat protein
MKRLFPLLLLLTFLFACRENSTPRINSDGVAVKIDPLDSINALIKSEPNNAELYFERAKEYYAKRNLISALSDIGRVLKLDSSKADYYILLADLKLIGKQSRESKDALLKAHQIEPKNINALLRLGELYMVVEDYKTSFDYLNQALQIDIHSATAYRLKGFNYKYAGDTAQAVSSFRTAIEQDPNDYDSYMQLGLLFSIPLSPLALDYYDNALRIKPSSAEALYAKALHLQYIENPREALSVYDQIIELNPQFYKAYYNKGFVYLELLNKFDSAAYFFSMAIEKGPEDFYPAVYNRGLSNERLGKFKEAESDYRQALKVNPQYDLAAIGLSRLGK